MNLVTPTIVTVALIAASFATLVIRVWALRRGLLDVPNARSSHALPTPRGGGVAIVLAFFLSMCCLFFFHLVDGRTLTALLVSGGAVALVGLLDDVYTVPAHIRFAVHVASAIFAVTLVGGLPERTIATSVYLGTLFRSVAAVFVIVWSINLFNFMDGIDGIAGAEAIFVAAGGAFLNWFFGGQCGLTSALLCLAAATAGFLAWNWPPARIFMGDVGSGFLGITLVLLALAVDRQPRLPVQVWPILGGIFVVDATVTLIRRMVRGDHWLQPHRLHGYQHLARRLQSHRWVTLMAITTNIFWLFPLAWLAVDHPNFATIALGVAWAPLAAVALLIGSGRLEDVDPPPQ